MAASQSAEREAPRIKRRCFPLHLLVLLSSLPPLTSGCSTRPNVAAAAAEAPPGYSPAWEAPAIGALPDERQVKTLSRIVARLANNAAASPHPLPVHDVLQSLRGPVVRSFSTSEAPDRRLTLTVTTRHAAWDSAMVAGSGSVTQAGTIGYYLWRWRLHRDRGNLSVHADNVLMLRSAFVEGNEQTLLGRSVNEALLYHELLHGQLLINAFEDAPWRDRLLSGEEFDSSPMDAGHRRIAGLERAYLSATTPLMRTIPASAAGSDGRFSLRLGSVPDGYRGPLRWQYRTLSHGNLKGLRVEVVRSGRLKGAVLMRGQLVDKAQDGFLLAAYAPATGGTSRVAARPPQRVPRKG